MDKLNNKIDSGNKKLSKTQIELNKLTKKEIKDEVIKSYENELENINLDLKDSKIHWDYALEKHFTERKKEVEEKLKEYKASKWLEKPDMSNKCYLKQKLRLAINEVEIEADYEKWQLDYIFKDVFDEIENNF